MDDHKDPTQTGKLLATWTAQTRDLIRKGRVFLGTAHDSARARLNRHLAEGRQVWDSRAVPALGEQWRLFHLDRKVLGSRLGERYRILDRSLTSAALTLRDRIETMRVSLPASRPGGLAGILRGAFYLGVAGFVMFVISGSIAYQSISSDFVPPDAVGVNRPAGGARILDRNGEVLYQFIDEDSGLRQPVPLEAVSPHLIAATIATEDASFFSNPGVNPEGLARAAWENFSPVSGSTFSGSGGSSITQQLVKNLYFTPEERARRSLDRKAREMVFSFKITDLYAKSQILTWYLNEISYGGVYNGIEAASRGYFGKPAAELSLAEAALLAGVPQSPAVYDPYGNPEAAVARRNQVLDLMATYVSIRVGEDARYAVDPIAIEEAKQTPLELKAAEPFQLNAPHFVLSYLKPELEARYGMDSLLKDGLVITTTLDLGLQRRAEEFLGRWIDEFEASSNTHNGATVIIDPRSGEILAMVGSRDYFRDDIEGQNNNLLAPNSPGSSFKPFVYLSLFLKQGSGPGFLIDDSPISVRQPDGSNFSPRNPTGTNSGWVTIRHALGNSLNVPAFRAAQAVGVHDIVTMGRQVGLTGLDGSYGPSIAIGGVDVKPLDLAYAYTVLANGGVMRGQKAVEPHARGERELDPVSILQVAKNDGSVLFESAAARTEKRIVPAEHAFLVNSILRDAGAQCATFGCGGLSIPGYDVAVKTGTSEPYDPNGPYAGRIGETWAFGYTPDVVVAVWAGNADNAPITNITSTSIAFRSMRDLMLAYYAGRRATQFRQPEGVTRARACFRSPRQVCVEDYFLLESLARGGANDPQVQRDDRSGAQQLMDSILGNRNTQNQRPANTPNRNPTIAPTPRPTATPRVTNRESNSGPGSNRNRSNNDDDD